MKLHLPSMLRKAVLSCMAAVASLSTTVATGVLTGGVVAWAIAAQQAQAGEWIADATSPEMYDCYKFTGADDATSLDITDGEHVKDGATWIRSYAANLSATVNSITQVADTTLNITGVWNDSTNSFNALTVETLKIGADGTGTGALKIGDSTATEQYITIHAVQGSLSTVTVKEYGNLTLGNGTDDSTFAVNTISVAEGGNLTIATGSTLDLTSTVPADATASTTHFTTLNNNANIITQDGSFIKIKVGDGGNNQELNVTGAINKNFHFANQVTFHGGGSSSRRSVTLGEGVALKAAEGMKIVSQGTFTVDGGSLEASKIILGHTTEANGSHFGKLVMNSGSSIKTGMISFYNAQKGNTLDINGGTLEFTGAEAIKYEGTNTATDEGRVTINIDDATLKAVSTSWTLDGKSSSYASINNTVFDVAAGKMITLTNVALGGAVTKQGAGELKLGTVAANLTSLNIQNGFVSSAAALNLTQLTLGAGAGFAYDLSSDPALVSADSYDGAITLHIRNAVAGESIALFQGAAGLQKEDVSIVGVSDRLEWDYEVTDGLVALTIEDGTPMDLTWDTAGPSNVWTSSGDANWDAAGSDEVFINGDSVTFAGTDADGAVTISGAVAPNNVTVSGTGYVIEGGSIAATGKLTVAENADLHLKSQASFAGGVEVSGTLTITDNYTTGNTQSLLGTISGAGNVDLYLGSTAIGFDFSGMTGGSISVKTGRLEANTSAFSNTSATLPTIELANSTYFVFNANQTVANKFIIADNANATFLVNRGDDRGAVISGDVNGGAGSTLTVLTNKQLVLQGAVAVEKLYMRGKLALENGANVVVSNQLRMGEEGSAELTIEDGAILTIQGSTNTLTNVHSFLVSHYGYNTSLILNGGELHSQNAIMRISFDNNDEDTNEANEPVQGTFSAIGGLANLYGISFKDKWSAYKGKFLLGVEGAGSPVINIGAGGIEGVNAADENRRGVTVTLGNGTLGATADWEMTGNGTVNLVGTTGTTFNTAAYTVKIAPTLSGTGKLIKTGTGTLEINAASTVADMSIQQGFVQAGAALTLNTLAVADGAGFAYDLSTTPALITAAGYNGKLTLNLSNVAEGNYDLFQGAADLNKENITLLGLEARLTAEKNVVNGLLSIHVQQVGGAKNLTWDTAGASNTWSTGGDINWDSDATAGADCRFYDGDSVTFAGEGEEITISGDVAPGSVTVSGSGYKFIGDGKMTGTGTLTVATNGSLEIAARQEYTGGTTINTGGTLKLGKYVNGQDNGKESYIRGDVSVYGVLEMIEGDVTGWGPSAQKIGAITVYSGGEINVNTTFNQTGAGLAINLQGGTMTGIAGSNFDLGYGGTTNSVINALAAEGASSDAPTVSNIDTVSLTLRQHTSSVNVAENAKLCISSVIKDRGGKSYLNNETNPGSDTITKLGSGELVLSGANTYTYATTVQAGTLTLADGGVLNSAVTVNNGATFKLHADTANVTFGAASISGEGAVIKTGSKVAQFSAASTLSKLDIQQGFVQAGAALTLTTLTVADGAGFAYDLSTTPALVTAGSYNGALTLKLSSVGAGTYELFQGAAGIQKDSISLINAETGAAIVSGGRSTVDLTVSDTGLVKVTVSLSDNLNDLEWKTADTDNVWANGGGTNWTSAGAGADVQFYNGDEVAFHGEGEEITISGTVKPAYITVTGTGYSFVGDGSIAGNGSILVTEDAALTIATDNSGFTGTTTIEEGGTLTMTHNQALGGSNGAPGTITGAGTLVVNVGSGNFVYATGANDASNLGGFTGTVDIESGKLQIGSTAANGDSLKTTRFGATRVIVRNGAALNTHFGAGSGINATDRATFASALDMMAGSTLYNIDGHVRYTGAVRFNIVDPAAATASYDAEGVVKIDQYYQKNMDFTGKISGDGTVQFCNPGGENGSAHYRITNVENDFAGMYQLVDDDGVSAEKDISLYLGAATAAQYADINLATTTSTSKLILDSDATINGLYGVVDADNAVQAQGGNRTLTVSEGDFGGVLKDGSTENVLSLTKQDSGTLVLRGANTYTGDTTIEKGILELAEGASMGATAISVEAHGKLQVNAGTYTNSISSTGGIVTKVGTGLATLSGIGDDFNGAIDVQGGTLNTGTALEIGNGRALMAGKTGAALSSALTLSDGWLELDFAGTGDALSLSDGALTLAGGSTLKLSNLELDTEQNHTVDLLIGVGRLLGSDGNELDLTGAMASTYFSAITGLDASIDTSTLGLQLADGKLQLVVPEQTKYLVWGEGTGTWAAGQDFSADDQDFTADADVEFGALTGESDTVSISGAIAAGKVLIDAGEGKTYVFSAADDTSGIASAESITVDSGTASFGAGTLDMTAATTISVNDGATLGLANGAIATPANVNIVLNDGSTLEWQSDNTADYSAAMDVADEATVSLTNGSGSGITLAGDTQAEGESATFNMSGNFTLNDDTVLRGTVNIGNASTVTLKGADGADADNYNQNFTGEGKLAITSNHGIHLTGTNTYSGNTVLNNSCRLYIDTATALSANTILTGGGNVALCDTVTLSGTHTLTGETAIGWDNVSGKTVTLVGSVAGNVKVYANNTLDLATSGVVNGTNGIENNGTLILNQGIVTKVSGSGTVQVDGDITWNNTNKTYTGETQVLAGSTLTAAAPLTSGTTKGKVQLMADEETDAVGTLVITNSANWANKVYGAGTLVLVNAVDNIEAIVDGAAADTLATAYVGMPVQTYGTTDVDGVLTIDDAAAAAATAKITDLVVNAGSSVNVSTTGGSLVIGQNLTLSGAGDATATAGTAGAAALAITTATGETKISSNITLAADATIYTGVSGDHRLTGSFNGAGYTLTKTGSGFIGLGEFAAGSTNDLSGDLDIQGGTIQLVGMGTETARQTIGKTTMATGTKLYFYSGYYDFADAEGAIVFNGDAILDLGAAATAKLSANVSGSSTVTMRASGTNSNGTLTLAAANEFSGTWKLETAAWKLNLAHTDAAQNATIYMTAGAALKLMDGVGTYDVKALKSDVNGASITTESSMRHQLNIINTLTAVANATYLGSVTGTVDVVLNTGAQKFTGTLDDGSSFGVLAGTLAIASTGQSGTHSFTASSGVLDMTGYTRAANATGEDTITALSGRVNGLNLAASMTLTGTSDVAAAMETITLGGSTVLGAGTMKFRVTDSDNTNPGTEDPYKLTNTLYQVGTETGDSISLAGGEAKTLLNLSIVNALTEILDPTEENAGDGYRDHTLIRGITLADANAAASDYFATNLDGENTGSTTYSLHFVQNAGNSSLYDLVLRAMGAADTLFWADAAGGTWEAADQTPDSWVKAQMTDGTLTPTTTTADFEQLDYVVFDDLTDEAGAPVAEVTITVADAGVQIGNMTVQADTTNYIFEGGEIGSVDDNDGATLTKTGTGTLTLKGANSYAGNTTITGGTVIAQHDAALSNTKVELTAGTLVLDFQNAGTDGELDALLLMKGGNTLSAKTDATVRFATEGGPKTFAVSSGKTLTLMPTNTDGTAGTAVAGSLQVNTADETADGTVKLVLLANTAYTSSNSNSNNINVGRGELVFAGAAATTTWSGTNKVSLAEDTTLRVQGGMTLSVGELAAWNGGDGTISLEDASKLTLTTGGAKTINTAIEAEGATLSATGTDAVMTVTDLTLKGTETNAAADTTLSGGTWVLEQGAVVWDTAATGALVVAGNTTVKVNDDTMKKLTVNASGAKLATAKADGSAAALSVETITVGSGGTVDGVNLTLTGTGSSFGSGGNMTAETADDVVVDLDDSIVMDDSTPEALVINGGVVLDSLTILRGEVRIQGGNWNRKIGGDAIVLNGSEAVLNLNGLNKIINAAGEAPTILIHAGSLKNAGNLAGHVIIDDKDVAQTIAMGGLKAANADVLLRDIETANGVTTLTGLNGVKLADGSAFELTANLAEGAGNLLFDFAEDAPADAAVSAATGATVSIGVSGVLGDVLDAGSVSYTIADKSIAPLASAVAWDATLALFNISAGFGEDGKLTLSATDVPLSEDDIYRSSEDNVGADKTQWAGNGANVYGSSAPYAAVYIDSDTVIDLTQAAAGAGDGLVLSNLIGRGNGANLTITGDGNDKVTINNNLEASDVVANLRALSFNGDMDVTGTTLQVLNTVATPDAPDAGELDTESVYQINGALTTDADSLVEVTAGILKLNGKGSKASELLGGVLVANGKGLLQVSGEASVGGNLDISISDSDDEDVVPDAEIVSGGKLTLLDGAAVMSGFDIQGQGEGKETLIIAKDAKVMLESYSSVTDTVLELQEGSELIWQGTETPYAAIVILDGLTGSGAIVNIADQDGQENPYIFINPQGDSTFSGDLSRYDGTIQVEADGEGTQRFDKVTTAADSSKVDMVLNGKSVINVAEGAGNKTLNLSTLALIGASDTTVEMNTDSGAPAFRIHAGSFMTDGAVLTLSSAVGEVLSADDDLLFMEGASEHAELAPLDGMSITLDITDNAFRRLNETAKLVVEGNKVYVDLAASETNRYEEGVSEPNAKAGAELLWNIDPSKLPADSALKAIDNAVAELMQNGNRDAAERALAATAGAGTAVLGSAFSADVERQLRAIRNRTTTMGVNQCEVNEGMPYVNAWINAEGDHREMDADGLAAGYTMDSWGGTVGFDVDITNNLTMGMAVTAMYGDLQADSADRAEGDFDTQYVSLFARVAHQAWTHTFVATLGRADVTLNRTVSVPGGSYETSGDTDGMAYGFMYEVARTFLLSEDGTTCWQPVFNVAWRHSSIDAYTESGADNALAVGEQDMNVLTFGAGARLQTVIGESLYNRASIFEARAMVKVDAGDREGEADVALLEGTTAASVKSAEIGAVGVEIGAGVTIPVGLNAGSIFIDGSAEFRSGYSNVNGTVGYRINF